MEYKLDEYFNRGYFERITDKEDLLEHFESFRIKPLLHEKIEFQQKDIIEITEEFIKENMEREKPYKEELKTWCKNKELQFKKEDLLDILNHSPENELNKLAFSTTFWDSKPNEKISPQELTEWLIKCLEEENINLDNWLTEQMINLIAADNAKTNKVVIFKDVLDSEILKDLDDNLFAINTKHNKIQENLLKSLNTGDLLILGDTESKKIIGSNPSDYLNN